MRLYGSITKYGYCYRRLDGQVLYRPLSLDRVFGYGGEVEEKVDKSSLVLVLLLPCFVVVRVQVSA